MWRDLFVELPTKIFLFGLKILNMCIYVENNNKRYSRDTVIINIQKWSIWFDLYVEPQKCQNF